MASFLTKTIEDCTEKYDESNPNTRHYRSTLSRFRDILATLSRDKDRFEYADSFELQAIVLNALDIPLSNRTVAPIW